MESFVAFARRTQLRRVAFGMLTVAALCAVGPVRAQTVDQRLDSVTVFGQAGATGKARGIVQTPMLEQVYYSANPLTPNVEIPLQGTHTLRSCQNTGTRGLYCLDYDPGTGKSVVMRWQNPDKEPTGYIAVRCEDLGLYDCTAMTVNLAGGRYLRVGVSFQMTDAYEDAVEGEEGEAFPHHDSSRIQDLLIATLGGRPVDGLATSDGRSAVKEEIHYQVDEMFEGEVMEIYFTEFVIQ